jgi:hypothetical protein
MPNDQSITVELTNDEALVLFEFLARCRDKTTCAIEHPSERQALWNLECILEKQLPEVLSPGYSQSVKSARERIRASE